MENVNEEYLNLIVKHLRGDASTFEENLLQEWLEESEEHKTAYRETELLWNAGKNTLLPAPDVDQAWLKVKARTGISTGTAVATEQEAKVRPMYSNWGFAKIAASVLLFIGIAYLLTIFRTHEPALVTLTSGEVKKEIVLPDSTKVWLNKHTTLSYSEDYNASTRTVHLDGEAFFEVRKNKEKPFIVNGRFSKTQVLGTSFNVRSLKNGSSDEVEVVEGKVSFAKKESNAGKVILLAGDKASVKQAGEIVKTKIQEENFLAWQSDQLIFENAPMEKVAKDLQAYFEVPVILQNQELTQCQFTGSFTKPKIEEILKVLSVSINLSYSKKDNAYLLTGKGCE